MKSYSRCNQWWWNW